MKTLQYIWIVLIFMANMAFAQSIPDYLILQNIGNYQFKTQGKDFITGQTRTIPGYATRIAPGFLVGADHFDVDHDDKTFETDYINRTIHLSVDVQVTQHAGGDSDKWLLHEVERGFQKIKDMGANYVSTNPLRDINGKKIFYTWGYYRWISNYVAVSIQFTDMTGTKPEPLEVVQAYLQKFPSTIPTTLVLDNAHKVQWIKNEMDRRLWLCDKWFMQLQLEKVSQSDTLQAVVKSMSVFLDYREKYYGVAASTDKNLLSGYLTANNGTAIKAKLTEYKNWWVVNKEKAISL